MVISDDTEQKQSDREQHRAHRPLNERGGKIHDKCRDNSLAYANRRFSSLPARGEGTARAQVQSNTAFFIQPLAAVALAAGFRAPVQGLERLRAKVARVAAP